MPNSDIVVRIQNCIKKHPSWDVTRISKTIQGARAALVRQVIAGETPTSTTVPSYLIPLKAAVEKVDIKAAIFRFLTTIKGNIVSEADLCREAASGDRAKFSAVVSKSRDEFAPYRVEFKYEGNNKKWYWGNSSDIDKIKSKLEGE